MSGEGIDKNRGGRPSERGEAKRAPINMRTTPTIRAALEDAAARGGRSLAQEIEQRLERSLQADEVRGSPESARLVDAITAEIAEVGRWNKPWWEDAFSYYATLEAVTAVIKEHAPLVILEDQQVRDAVQALIKAEDARDAAIAAGNHHALLDVDVAIASKAFEEAMEPQRQARETARRVIQANRRMLRRMQDEGI